MLNMTPSPELLFPSTQEGPRQRLEQLQGLPCQGSGGPMACLSHAHSSSTSASLNQEGPDKDFHNSAPQLPSCPLSLQQHCTFLPHSTFQSTFGLFQFPQPVSGAVALCKPWFRRGQNSLQAHTWLVTPVVNGGPTVLSYSSCMVRSVPHSPLPRQTAERQALCPP